MVSTGVSSLDQVLGDGYPDRSSILVVGAPGIGKETLGYWFIRSGLIQGDYCLYATHRRVADVIRDIAGVGIGTERVPEWIASAGSATRCDIKEPSAISFNIKQAVGRNQGRRVRVATDLLSPLLVLNQLEPMYSYWSQLISELKQYDSVLFAMAEDGMHSQNVLTTMEQLFDGVIEMRLYEEGLNLTPLFRVKKMLGSPPLHGYFRFSVTQGAMEVVPHIK